MPKKKLTIRTTSMPKPTSQEKVSATLYISECPCLYPEKIAIAKERAREMNIDLTIKRTSLDSEWQLEAKKYKVKYPFIVIGDEAMEL